MEWCDVGRGGLAVDVIGPADGPPVLLVAGGGGAAWSWGRVVPGVAGPDGERLEPLVDGLAGHRVAVFDQAGIERSLDTSPPMTASQYAEDAARVGHQALGERFAVVGLSLGGAAALQLALRDPATVSALVLVCTFAGAPSFANHDLGPPPPFDPADLDLDPALRDEARKSVVSFGAAFPHERPALFAEIVRRSVRQRCDAGLGDSQIAQFMSHDVTDRLAEIAVPTAVVCGDQDRTMPLANSQLLAGAIPGASLSVLRGVGHAVHFEAPEAIAAAVHRVTAR